MDSILIAVRGRCGISEFDEDFDKDLIPAINMVFAHLAQLGAGPARGFLIEDDTTLWSDYIPDDGYHSNILLGFIKEFMYCKVRVAFDPPSSSVLMDALKRSADEYEQRIIIELETPTRTETTVEEDVDDILDNNY